MSTHGRRRRCQARVETAAVVPANDSGRHDDARPPSAAPGDCYASQAIWKVGGPRATFPSERPRSFCAVLEGIFSFKIETSRCPEGQRLLTLNYLEDLRTDVGPDGVVTAAATARREHIPAVEANLMAVGAAPAPALVPGHVLPGAVGGRQGSLLLSLGQPELSREPLLD
jgi:hypothetical protein